MIMFVISVTLIIALIVGMTVLMVSMPILNYLIVIGAGVLGILYIVYMLYISFKKKNYNNLFTVFFVGMFLPFLFYSYENHYLIMVLSYIMLVGLFITLIYEIIRYKKSIGIIVFSAFLISFIHILLNNLETIGVIMQRRYLPKEYSFQVFSINYEEGPYLIVLLLFLLLSIIFIPYYKKKKQQKKD